MNIEAQKIEYAREDLSTRNCVMLTESTLGVGVTVDFEEDKWTFIQWATMQEALNDAPVVVLHETADEEDAIKFLADLYLVEGE